MPLLAAAGAVLLAPGATLPRSGLSGSSSAEPQPAHPGAAATIRTSCIVTLRLVNRTDQTFSRRAAGVRGHPINCRPRSTPRWPGREARPVPRLPIRPVDRRDGRRSPPAPLHCTSTPSPARRTATASACATTRSTRCTSRSTTSTPADTIVGVAQTYLNAFGTRTRRRPVSWLWPLIDRPHRIVPRHRSSTTT